MNGARAIPAYRPDIDGLRAIAVVLVMLFHADLGFRGGFVGVDVFFVLSGFLITRILSEDQSDWRSRLVDFWVRRVRRILPAALVVAAVTLVCGGLILLPDDYAELAASAIAQQFMCANVYFCRSTGYFHGDSARMPLLHTWSLAVEEQFYVVYPLLLLGVGRLSRMAAIVVMLTVTVVSFGASDWVTSTHPKEAFYLLPTRAWEILLGGLVWLAPLPRNRPRGIADTLAVCGVAGIFLAATWFDDTTRFPGRAALVPCVATALVIYANSLNTTWVARTLAIRPIVFFGLISYSLYLWHWPILAFLRYLWCGAQPSVFVRGCGLAASVLLAVGSWRYVELPVRRNVVLTRRKHLAIAAVTAVALLVAAATAILRCHGLPQRFSQQSLAYASAKKSKAFLRSMHVDEVRAGKLPRFGSVDGSVSCLVWGDSHAMALIAGLDAACKTYGVRGFQATRLSTSPRDRMFMDSVGQNTAASAFHRAVVEHVLTHKIDIVILACVWARIGSIPGFEQGLRATIRELTEAGVHVVIVRDVARFQQEADPPLLLSMAARQGRDVASIGVPYKAYAVRNKQCNAMIDRCVTDQVTVLDPAPTFVDATGLWRAEYGGVSMYRDYHHLSIEGSLRLTPMFADFFDAFFQRQQVGPVTGNP